MPTDAHAPILATRGLAVGYDGQPLLPAVTFAIGPGETWAIVGRNGAGKSTLLKTLLGVQRPVRGGFEWHREARVSHVAQRSDHDLSVPGRVKDFVREGVDEAWSFLDPLRPRRRRAQIQRAMRDCDVLDLASSRLAELSEGQRQRVLVARALASEPTVLVLDEPTSAMDPMNERAVFELLASLRAERGLTVLVVSHQMTLVTSLASHGLLVDKDADLALAAPIAELTEHAAFLDRYGWMTA